MTFKHPINFIYVFIFMLLGGTFLAQKSNAQDEPKKVFPSDSSVLSIPFSTIPVLTYGDELTEDAITVLESDAFEISFPKLEKEEYAYAGLSWGYFENSVFEGNGEAVNMFLNLQLISDLGDEKLKVEITDTDGETVSYYANGLEDYWQTYQFDVSDLNGNLAFVYFVYAAPYDQPVNSAQVKVKAGYIGLTVDVLPGDNTLQLTDFSVVPSLAYGGVLTKDLITVLNPAEFELSLPTLGEGQFVYAGLSWGYFENSVFKGTPAAMSDLLILELRSDSGIGNKTLKVEITNTDGKRVSYYINGLTNDWQTYRFDLSKLEGDLASVLFVCDTPDQGVQSVSVRAGSIGLTVDVLPGDNTLQLTDFSVAPVLAYGGELTKDLIAVPNSAEFELLLPQLSLGEYVYAGLSWGYFDSVDPLDPFAPLVFNGYREVVGEGPLTLRLKSEDLGDKELKVEITDTAGEMVSYHVLGLIGDSYQTYSFDISSLNGELASVLCVYDTSGSVKKSIYVQAGSIGLAVDVSPIDDSFSTPTAFDPAASLAYGGVLDQDLINDGVFTSLNIAELTRDLITVPNPDEFKVSLRPLNEGEFIFAGFSWGYFADDPDDNAFIGRGPLIDTSLILELKYNISQPLADKELKVEITDTTGQMVPYTIRGLSEQWQLYRFDVSYFEAGVSLASILFVYDTSNQDEKSVSIRARHLGLTVDVSPDPSNPALTAFSTVPSVAYGGELTRGDIAVPNNPDEFELSLPTLKAGQFGYAGLSWGYFDPDTNQFIGTPEVISDSLTLELQSDSSIGNKKFKVEITDTAGQKSLNYVNGLTSTSQRYQFDISGLNGNLASVLFVYDTPDEDAKSVHVKAGRIGLTIKVKGTSYDESKQSNLGDWQPRVIPFEGSVSEEVAEDTYVNLNQASTAKFDFDFTLDSNNDFIFIQLAGGYFQTPINEDSPFYQQYLELGLPNVKKYIGKTIDLSDAPLIFSINGPTQQRLKLELVDSDDNRISYLLELTGLMRNYSIDLALRSSEINPKAIAVMTLLVDIPNAGERGTIEFECNGGIHLVDSIGTVPPAWDSLPNSSYFTPQQVGKLYDYARATVRYFTSEESNNKLVGFAHGAYSPTLERLWYTPDGNLLKVPMTREIGSFVNMNEVTLRFLSLALAYKMGWLNYIDEEDRYSESWGQIKLGLESMRAMQMSPNPAQFKRTDPGLDGILNTEDDKGRFHRIYLTTAGVFDRPLEGIISDTDLQSSDDNGLPIVNLYLLEGLINDLSNESMNDPYIQKNDTDDMLKLCVDIRDGLDLDDFIDKTTDPWQLSFEFLDGEQSISPWDRLGAEGPILLSGMLVHGAIDMETFNATLPSMKNKIVDWPIYGGSSSDIIQIKQASYQSALFIHGLRNLHGFPVTPEEAKHASYYNDSVLPLFRAHKDYADYYGVDALGTQVMTQLLKDYLTFEIWNGESEGEGSLVQVKFAGNEESTPPSREVFGGDGIARITGPHAFFIPLGRPQGLFEEEIDWIFEKMALFEDEFLGELVSDTSLGWQAAIPWSSDPESFYDAENLSAVSWLDTEGTRHYANMGHAYETLNSGYLLVQIFDALNEDQPLASYNVKKYHFKDLAARIDSNTPLSSECYEGDRDCLPDDWEYNYFGHLDEGPEGDPDNDGLPNIREYELGTDPTSSLSGIYSDSDVDGLINGLELYFAKDINAVDGSWYDEVSLEGLDGESYVAITFKRPANLDSEIKDKVIFQVTDTIEDPTSWTSEKMVEVLIDDGDLQTIQIQIPTNNRTKLFVRARMVE